MLRKVPGASHLKDKLKHRLHAPTSGEKGARHRSYSSRSSKQSAVSFSAMDNRAFESILDDDSDFMVVPPVASKATPVATKMAPATVEEEEEEQHSGLFDDDMFGDQNFTEDDILSSLGDSQEVNYDPLSGQIVSKHELPSNSDRESGGIEKGGEIEREIEEDGLYVTAAAVSANTQEQQASGVEDEVREIAGERGDENGTIFEEGGAKLKEEDPMVEETEEDGDTMGTETLTSLEERGGNLESETEVSTNSEETALLPNMNNYLFDEQIEDTDQAPLAEDLLDSSFQSTEDSDDVVSKGVDVVHSLESPVSSLPSSIEADAYFQGEVGVERVPTHRQVHGVERGNSLASSTHKKTHVSGTEITTSDLEAELQQMLASKANSHAGMGTREGQRRSLDREGNSSTHLDSGVYEGKEATERDGSSTAHSGDDQLPIHYDHFTHAAKHRSTSMPIVDYRPSSKPSTQSKKNSLGQAPPPRPPISPQVQKRMKSANNVSSHKKDDVSVKLVTQLGSAKVISTPWAVKVEEGGGVKREEGFEVKKDYSTPPADLSSDDELFPDDVKKMEELTAPKTLTDAPPFVHHHHDPVIPVDPDLNATETESISGKPSGVEEDSEFVLPIQFHLLLSLVLYLYYSLNVFPYLAGLFAGFLMLYMFLGSVFIYYVQTIEKEREERQQEKKEASVRVSEDFVQTMKVDFSKLQEYKSTRFTATLKYDAATHHPRQRLPAEISLKENFKFFVNVLNHENLSVLCRYIDIRNCTVSIEPAEVAKNRKRRWSKKFPIFITCTTGAMKFKVYIFSPTARAKEDWFRRLKNAASGLTSLQLIQKQKEFFGYMEKYFPRELLQTLTLEPPKFKKQTSQQNHHHHQHTSRSVALHQQQMRMANTLVQFSKSDDAPSSEDPEVGEVNITQKPSSVQAKNSVPHHGSYGSGVSKQHTSNLPALDEHGFEHVQYSPSSARRHRTRKYLECRPNQWLNSLAARLCWDIWHDQRWKDWVMSRIQKKLIRTKTPSFMEQLQLTNIDVGNDMPMINQLIGGPRMDLRGIWVYLDVTYQGKFVMTIETKMKLGGKGEGGAGQSEEGQQMVAMTKSKDKAGLPMNSPHSSSHRTKSTRPLSHSQAAHALASGGDGSSVDPEEEIDSGSDEEEGSSGHQPHHPLLEDDLTESQELLIQTHGTSPTATPEPVPPSSSVSASNKARIKSMVTRVAKKVANTKFVRRAAEKVSNYSLVLTVEVNRLDGILAVNIPPPPSDTIWWGFHGSPKLELVAKPKVGHREVKLSKVTHWIERKLCDIVDKKLVLPEMEDLVIPILNSGMAEDILKPISSDPDPATPTAT